MTTIQKSCITAKSEVDGIGLGLGIFSILALGVLYSTSESRYPGTGIQSLIYGGAIIGGVYVVSSIPMTMYSGYYCNTTLKSSR